MHTEHGTPYARGGGADETVHPTPHTLHPSPYTLHPTPCTLHPTPYTLHPTPYTLNSNPGTWSREGPHSFPQRNPYERGTPAVASFGYPRRGTPVVDYLGATWSREGPHSFPQRKYVLHGALFAPDAALSVKSLRSSYSGLYPQRFRVSGFRI